MFKIFIGYLFVFFHFRINGFDVLLNPVGYALVFMGLCSYSGIQNFNRAKTWAAVMAIISCAEIFIGLSGLNDIIIISFGLISVLVSLVLIYFIDKGIAELEQKTGKQLNSDKLMTTWKYQAVLTVASTVLTATLNEFWVYTIVGISAMVAHIVFLYYIYKAHKLFLENTTDGETPEI